MRLGLTLSVLRTARALQQLTRHGSRPALRRGAVVAAEPPARPRARAPRATGKLRQLPHAPKADELLRRAASRAAKVPRDAAEPNARRRAAKQAAARADAMGQAVSVPLRQVLDAHAPEALRRSLHPFEHATATLTAAQRTRTGARAPADVLADIAAVRLAVLAAACVVIKFHGAPPSTRRCPCDCVCSMTWKNLTHVLIFTQAAARDGAAAAKAAPTARDAATAPDAVLAAIERELAGRGRRALEELRGHQRALRRIPTVSLRAPTLVLVGAPNVGKSTLVRALSTGEPEVGNYAFTTRGVSLGHVYDGGALAGQVMDTPGLLDRDAAARNAMEDLTMATMDHLPSAVVFVCDLSGHAGERTSSPDAQLAVRDALRARFPRRPWIDVVSKADLYDAADAPPPPPDGALLVSVRQGRGLPELRAAVLDALAVVRRLTGGGGE